MISSCLACLRRQCRRPFLYHCRSLSSDGTGNSHRRLKHFLDTEKETCEKLNQELALPYVDINGLVEDIQNRLKHRNSKSALMNAVYKGQLHRPAIPMKFILANKKAVEENLKTRKMPGIVLDLQQDIIEPYERILKLRKKTEQYVEKRAQLTDSMKDFWVENKEKEKLIPAEIEQQRQEAINTSCIINILSWIEDCVEKLFYEKALLMPNMTHPLSPVGVESNDVKIVDAKHERTAVVNHLDIGEVTSTIKQSNISNFSGQRTYYLFQEVADLEQALVRYTIDRLKEEGFLLISCPNILHGSAYEGCGVASTKLSDMLYHIDSEQENEFYIAGTSEVGIASYFANHAISSKHLPLKLCCVSTCNRKETDNRADPRGLYRVHHFTKVEMFGLTANDTGKESEAMFNEFLRIQEKLFSDLGLHFRIINMPTSELGLPAYQKVDMEAWMPSRDDYGEISSTSNCTDFQSRRLHILYKNKSEYRFAHTLNGTACAIPRMIISLMENNQTEERNIQFPEVLRPYMKKTTVDRRSRITTEYIGPNQSKRKQKTPKE